MSAKLAETTEQDVPHQRALKLLLAECNRLYGLAKLAEEAAASLATAGRHHEHPSLQHLDAITQNLAGITTFLGSWIDDPDSQVPDLSKLTSSVLPRDLAQRLGGLSAPSAEETCGEVDLF
jgi:hypothetical protein